MSELLSRAQTLETEGQIPQAIQAYEDLIRNCVGSDVLAFAYHRLGEIYRDWGELFTVQRLLSQAHQHDPQNSDIRNSIDSLNEYFSQNREIVADTMSRQNSDQIVSLFRIATGIKLLSMDKPTQAYPLMKSRTKIFPNAAVAKHILTDVSIGEDERNSAIEFLIDNEWLNSSGVELYSIADSGLYVFYTELAGLHIDNLAFSNAVDCLDQAIWLDSSQLRPFYQRAICYASLEEWERAESEISKLSSELPAEIDAIDFHTAVAECYHNIYQKTGDDLDKSRVIEACEEVLRLDKKNKVISKLLNEYQEQKRWWRK